MKFWPGVVLLKPRMLMKAFIALYGRSALRRHLSLKRRLNWLLEKLYLLWTRDTIRQRNQGLQWRIFHKLGHIWVSAGMSDECSKVRDVVWRYKRGEDIQPEWQKCMRRIVWWARKGKHMVLALSKWWVQKKIYKNYIQFLIPFCWKFVFQAFKYYFFVVNIDKIGWNFYSTCRNII